MPADDSSALIVARFLKANHYTQSYEAFIKEAGLSEDAGDISSATLTLERLLEEKRLFDQSVNFEKLNLDDKEDKGWTTPAPTTALVISSLPGRSNVLNVLVDTKAADTQLIASTSDRRINVIKLPDALKASWPSVQDAPVLSQLVLRGTHHVSASMSGSLVVADIESGEIIGKRKDHTKYIVGLAFHDNEAAPLLASAGWDNVINIYAIDLNRSSVLDTPLATIALPTKPESILFTTHPDTGRPILVMTRTDSSHLHFWSAEKEPIMLGKQNLAPHSNAWVAFTPTSIALCPTDSTTIAVATNSTPHMKLIIVKLLIPSGNIDAATPQTVREQALEQQATADREHGAIQLHCNTMSAQTPYSTPLVVWRPDGRGVWVNSDDGIIRGIDVLSGKVVCELREHENGSKVRTLWSGFVSEDGQTTERLVSGGFDHKLIVWKT